MSSTDNGKRSRCSRATKTDYGAFDPDKFWGQVLPSPTTTTTNQPDAFDARVERAWAYMKGAYFAAEEHERLRVVLARLITADTL
jgi:hypothetical protein